MGAGAASAAAGTTKASQGDAADSGGKRAPNAKKSKGKSATIPPGFPMMNPFLMMGMQGGAMPFAFPMKTAAVATGATIAAAPQGASVAAKVAVRVAARATPDPLEAANAQQC